MNNTVLRGVYIRECGTCPFIVTAKTGVMRCVLNDRIVPINLRRFRINTCPLRVYSCDVIPVDLLYEKLPPDDTDTITVGDLKKCIQNICNNM